MKTSLLFSIGLLFIFEGLLPFLAPQWWRRAMHHMMTQSDRSLHLFGFISMMIGCIIIYLVHLNT